MTPDYATAAQAGYQAAPQAAPQQQYQQPGMAGYGAAPLSTNEIIAQEVATTIRHMIAQEVDRQLKALLAPYTGGPGTGEESTGGQ
jgi:hypothetical protein